MKILIIDDDQLIQRMLKRRLHKAGYEVETANNGKLGIQKIDEFKPHLILMDMHMPVMDGFSATRELREKGYNQVPIVALTASATAQDIPKAISAGCDHFIAKPIGKDFEKKIEMFLKGGEGE